MPKFLMVVGCFSKISLTDRIWPLAFFTLRSFLRKYLQQGQAGGQSQTRGAAVAPQQICITLPIWYLQTQVPGQLRAGMTDRPIESQLGDADLSLQEPGICRQAAALTKDELSLIVRNEGGLTARNCPRQCRQGTLAVLSQEQRPCRTGQAGCFRDGILAWAQTAASVLVPAAAYRQSWASSHHPSLHKQ